MSRVPRKTLASATTNNTTNATTSPAIKTARECRRPASWDSMRPAPLGSVFVVVVIIAAAQCFGDLRGESFERVRDAQNRGVGQRLPQWLLRNRHDTPALIHREVLERLALLEQRSFALAVDGDQDVGLELVGLLGTQVDP